MKTGLCLGILLSIASTSTMANSSDPIEVAFENYKTCIKTEVKNGNKVNIENYKKFCTGELSNLSAVMGDAFPYSLNVIEKWIKTFS